MISWMPFVGHGMQRVKCEQRNAGRMVRITKTKVWLDTEANLRFRPTIDGLNAITFVPRMLASDTPMCLLFCPSPQTWREYSCLAVLRNPRFIENPKRRRIPPFIRNDFTRTDFNLHFPFSIWTFRTINAPSIKKKSSHCSIVDGIAACADIETHLLERASHELLNKHTVLGSESDWKWISPRAQWMTANLNI